MVQEPTAPVTKDKPPLTLGQLVKKLALYDLLLSGVIALGITIATLAVTGAIANTAGMSTGNMVLALLGVGLPTFIMTWLVGFGIIAIAGAIAMILWAFFGARKGNKTGEADTA